MKPKGDWTSMRRKDLGLLLVVGVLFAALTFNLGMYWGIQWGLNQNAANVPHSVPELQKDSVLPPAPQNDWHAKEQIPQDIRDAFVKSKQSALVESQLRNKDRVIGGTSIADTETYFRERKLPWGEGPKESLQESRAIASEPESAKKTAQKVAPGLFERSPASVDEFKPTPGMITVQVASYATQDEAQTKVKALIASGVQDAYYTQTKVKGENWYQVSVGSYKDKEWAKKSGDRLVRRNLASDFFVKKVSE